MAGPSDKMTKEPSFASRVQQFDFCGESIDAALRKLLAQVLLPKEAQQIDRAMEDFAKRYYECNPSLVDNPDVVYAVAFSILLLHTDAHNKNVKQKMNKDTFIMRTKIIEGGEGVPHEILDVMYDNIVMSEFTYADGHKESSGRAAAAAAPAAPAERSNSWFSKLKSGSSSSDTNAHTQSALLADLGQKLEQIMPAENTFSYKRTLKPIPIMEVHFSILRAKSLLLAGVRSRYGGGGSGDNNTNTFTIRVTKAGILDRKYDLTQGGKKATARGWRPFGCILSGSQIIFFADISSFQNWLDHREDHDQQPQEEPMAPRRNNSFPAFSSLASAAAAADTSCSNLSTVTSLASMYPPPPQQQNIPTNAFLRPVQIVSLSYAICICDEEYTKYPHVFRLITGDGQQFLLRAEDDQDMEDWMLKINYAATLKTTGVRMRPTKKPTSNGNESTRSIDTTTSSSSNNNKYNADRLKREEKAREKVIELTQRIDEQVKLLDRELQLRRNLMALIPCQKATKDRILLFADTVGKKLKTKRIELQRLECYRDYLECELSWCASQQQQQQQQQQQRKMSLPLPSHLYTFTASHNNSNGNAVTLPVGGTGAGKKESIKKLSNLVFTAPPSQEPSPVTTSSSTTSSSHHMLLESSSCVSDLTHSASHMHSAISDGESVNSNSVLQEHQHDDTNNHGDDDDDDDRKSNDSTPQLPSFSFPKSFIEGVSFMDSKNVKTASDKVVEMDRIMRRRSQSNPVMPHTTRSPIIDKKLLLVEAPSHARGGRQRSGSEASSVQGDDDDMSVVIVNDSEELLTDTSTWPTTTTSVTTHT